jgi:hypothetical protein
MKSACSHDEIAGKLMTCSIDTNNEEVHDINRLILSH